MKTVLVLIDGMRPDAMVKIDYANELMQNIEICYYQAKDVVTCNNLVG